MDSGQEATWRANESKPGMSIRFFKVQGVDASAGQMRLKVWVRLQWTLDTEVGNEWPILLVEHVAGLGVLIYM